MRILIVEDEPGIFNFLKQGLEEESYAVDIAEEGKKVLNWHLLENTTFYYWIGWYQVLAVSKSVANSERSSKKHPLFF